jgi:hypothetical protein
MNIRDLLINKQIRQEAVKTQKDIITQIDRTLLSLHEIKIGKREPFGLSLNIEDTKLLYNFYVEIRRRIAIPTDDFIFLDIDKIINTIPTRFEHERKELINCMYE